MGVEFEEQFSRGSLPSDIPSEGGLIGLLIKIGLAKNREQALLLLLVCGVIIFLIAGYLFYNYGKAPSVEMTPVERATVDARVRQIESGARITN